MDIQVEFERGTSNATGLSFQFSSFERIAGLLIRTWLAGGEGTAAIVFDWDRSTLEVIFEALDPDTMEFDLGNSNACLFFRSIFQTLKTVERLGDLSIGVPIDHCH